MHLKALAALGFSVALLCGTVAAEEAYKFLNEIPIGGEGGWDYMTVDAAGHRLYLSHATKVVVVDLTKNAVIGEIGDTPGVHGLIVVPDLERGFSSNGKESKVSVVDLKTLRMISKIETGANPDALVYEPRHGEVYVFNHSGNSATVINAKTAGIVNTIARQNVFTVMWKTKAKSRSSTRQSTKWWRAGHSRPAPSQLEWRSTRPITGCSSAVITN